MKKMLFVSSIVALVVSGASADFSFGDMFKDMKEAAISMSKDAKDSVVAMKDGAVETSKSAERTVTSVSKDAKDSAVKVSDDLKTAEVSTSKDSRDSLVEIARRNYQKGFLIYKTTKLEDFKRIGTNKLAFQKGIHWNRISRPRLAWLFLPIGIGSGQELAYQKDRVILETDSTRKEGSYLKRRIRIGLGLNRIGFQEKIRLKFPFLKES